MALSSPGVQVNVIDESFYTPSSAGTVPMIFVASAENKISSGGSGVAVGTLKSNAGKPYLITSQRELGETFGDPLFYSDSNGNMINGGELNEYGLQTAYSLLGVSNRVYVVRADLNLAKLQASANAPGGEPADGAYWFDTQVTNFGFLEWNSAALTTSNGQSFSTVPRTVIVEASDLDGNVPKRSIGQIGNYAVVAETNMNRVYYKTPGASSAAGNPGDWVEVGSQKWKASWSSVRSSVAPGALTTSGTIIINNSTVTLDGTDVAAMVTAINSPDITGITAAAPNGLLEIYSTGVDVIIAAGGGTLLGELNLVAGTYIAPVLAIQPHTNVPAFKSSDPSPAPTGSIWLKTTEPNGGAKFSVKQYNGDTQLWELLSAPLFSTPNAALFNLDKAGGGTNIMTGDVYVKVNADEEADPHANYKIFRRVSQGPSQITSATVVDQLTGAISFSIQESTVGRLALSTAQTITFEAAGTLADAETMAAAINAAGFVNVVAMVNATNKVVIQHKLGGEIRITDSAETLALIGFDTLVVSNWRELEYTASPDEPLSLTADGEIWYNSVVDEVDIMIHDGNGWVGYANELTNTDAAGPIVSASEPTTQRNSSALVEGDLWIDTADIDNYPGVYRYSAQRSEWILLDKTDQTSEEGILFADARWGNAGSDSAPADIDELLTSDYLDPDAPDPALYPKGMLLWNMRRSGFNVKRYVRNYIDTAGDNIRFSDEAMQNYYPNRWVTDSGNNIDGSGSFGRIAQRKSVVQAFQAMVNGNQQIRDEESRQFNLMATPGYPELIGEMITLNYDRRITAFVVGDTPARLAPDATSLNEWGSNVNLAVEDNINGAVSRDEYMGMYYLWGFTSDNFGNNIVVPPSHMALRTIVLNDQVAFPWFAPAGTRRGGVTNASASGYISSEGEFVSVALNTGQRDTLYANSINPITFISGAGLVVFGQNTRARNASALDRINVARLVVYLRGQFELLARPYLFEPNDKITRDQIKAAADSLLLELVGLRGIYDFVTVCDESNNTPSRIDRNELFLDVAIEPVKAIEFIFIPLRIKNTGEIASLG